MHITPRYRYIPPLQRLVLDLRSFLISKRVDSVIVVELLQVALFGVYLFVLMLVLDRFSRGVDALDDHYGGCDDRRRTDGQETPGDEDGEERKREQDEVLNVQKFPERPSGWGVALNPSLASTVSSHHFYPCLVLYRSHLSVYFTLLYPLSLYLSVYISFIPSQL